MPDERLERLAAALAGRYQLERELGQGGMATVYLAQDLKHSRRVAIKVLAPALAQALGDGRFIREITTTANLRHPNILPLYDSGESDGTLYYVMPFVEGESLRDRLDREKQLPVEDAIRIATEVADALSYAHARGVLHRDIKPANILLDSGHAVVADFGIARAIDVAGGDRLTETGVIMGTPAYMSPEQAAGEKNLDARTDEYALACLLYEMLAGQPPFTGPTAESVIRQHLLGRLPRISQFRTSVSPDIATALERGLAKTPADRFTTVTQFREAITRGHALPDGLRPPIAPLRRSRGTLIVVAVGLALAAIATFLFLRPRPVTPIQLGRRTQVTIDPGLEIDPAMSPDGKLVAYSDRAGRLMVRQVDGGSPVQLLQTTDGIGRWPAWFPSGDRLLFISSRGIETVPALGGAPRLLVASTAPGRGIAVAPDGKTFVFVSHDSLLAESVDGGNPRLVTHGWEVHSPAWSPDGRRIAFVSGDVQFISSTDLGNLARSSVWVVDASGNSPAQVTDNHSLNVSPTWATSRSLLSISDRDGGRDVYEMVFSSSGKVTGRPVRITTGLNPLSIAISLDGRRLAFATFSEISNIWSLAIPPSGSASLAAARPETEGSQMIENEDVSHDGRWLGYSSDRGSISQVYRMRVGALGSEQQVTNDTANAYWAAWSPGDNELAFDRFHGEQRQVFVTPVEGGSPVPVTDGSEDERTPEWSPDGRQLLILANWASKGTLRIVSRSADGTWGPGRVLPVVINGDTVRAGLAVWSPDGHWVACGCGEGGIVIIPVAGGPARRLDNTFSSAGWAFPQSSADGQTIYYLSEDSAHAVRVVAAPVDGRAGHEVMRFDVPSRPWHRYGFRVRGERMFFTVGDRQGDVWVAALSR